MNILKTRYPELYALHQAIPNIDHDGKDLFRGLYLTKKMTKNQDRHWKDLLARKQTSTDNQSFLSNLLHSCHRKNRLNILLTNIDLKMNNHDYLSKNSLISHIYLSNIWFERRKLLSDEAVIYLLSEFTIIECLTRKRKLFMQISGTHETFYSLPYYIARKAEEKQQAHKRAKKINTRKRTIQFHLHATKEGQQAHLTDLYETSIPNHLMHYHVSKFERFDVYSPIEKAYNGEMLVEAFFSSDFSKGFFSHRPKEEVEQIRENLIPIFERFRSNHHEFYLRRRSRLPLAYTLHHIPEPTATVDQLISLTTPLATVQHFVRVWLTHVFPVELFGTKYNSRLFIRRMCFILQLPRIQQYSPGEVMQKLKLNKCQWTIISNKLSSLVRHLYFGHLIYFLIHYVLTLSRSYFYATEGSSPSHPLVMIFYRHKIWYAIQQKSRCELLEKACAPTVQQEFVSDCHDIRYLWKVRFVPKKASVRYLACAQEGINTKENINHLKYTNEVLKYLRRHNKHLLGIATFNRVEMHRRWQEYCQTAPKVESGSMTYFLRSDVSNFYDSINIDCLDQALVEFLNDCEFNYNLHIHTIYKTQYRNGRIIRKRTLFWVGKENESMCATLLDDTKPVNNGIFHDMVIHEGHIEVYDRAKLLKYIRAQLYNSYLYTRHSTMSSIKSYRRTVGINHGLRIASMLGQIYLNKIDNDIKFSPLEDEFAVRHEDDLLIISPHRYRLRRIKLHMNQRLNELHHITNPLKTSLKTKTNIRHKTMKKIRPVEYWGSLVDIQSRQIFVSINPNENIQNKINHLTIKVTREPGYNVRQSLLNALSLRSHSYYFDRLYTTANTLIKNFYSLSCYYFKRLHSICYRFAQIYSNQYVQSKSLFLFRTIRSGLRLLIKKAFIFSQKSTMVINQCKYVFFIACLRLIRRNKHLFQNEIMTKRFAHMIKKLKYLPKKRKHDLKKLIGIKQ
ncbi:unnamed protein product [Adineta ricciae]|uniref:Telomerase reverse transcriptase n=1 Tax=Adineta ricciae TaxID=249248 RepID=A0A813PAE6_ADIRI|nr:unnamed protein product [Adineta ricciae]